MHQSMEGGSTPATVRVPCTASGPKPAASARAPAWMRGRRGPARPAAWPDPSRGASPRGRAWASRRKAPARPPRPRTPTACTPVGGPGGTRHPGSRRLVDPAQPD